MLRIRDCLVSSASPSHGSYSSSVEPNGNGPRSHGFPRDPGECPVQGPQKLSEELERSEEFRGQFLRSEDWTFPRGPEENRGTFSLYPGYAGLPLSTQCPPTQKTWDIGKTVFQCPPLFVKNVGHWYYCFPMSPTFCPNVPRFMKLPWEMSRPPLKSKTGKTGV